jgi:nucleoside-diphosphate-sugar epimerase
MAEHVLITGISGFIGGHLAAGLHAHGYKVSGVDRCPMSPQLTRIVSRFTLADLRAPGGFQATLDACRPDRVIHLAAQVGRVLGEDDLQLTAETNATMTTLVAYACGLAGIPLMYASTSEIYGDHGDELCSEDSPWRLPHNLYGLSKRWGEEAAALYAPEGLQIIRPSMPYGPGAPPGRGRRAMDNFIWHALYGRPIPVHRGAERSWCWIGDVVEGVRLITESGETGAWNVGRDDQRLSMERLARMIVDLVGGDPGQIELITPPENQTVVKRLSTDRLRSLGWQPRIELRDGLRRMIDWIACFDADGNYSDGRPHHLAPNPARR